MFATRIARAVTGRKILVRFVGSYHGTHDAVLLLPSKLGLTRGASEDSLMLPNGDPGSLEQIRKLGDQVAAVLVEPVQSRRPDYQPVQFIRDLRQVTKEIGAVLIFDEIVTGVRSHIGGVRGYFDLEADIITYGKCFAGGLPIGIVAGSRKYLSAVDGGLWQFGDASTPDNNITLIDGTYCKHPLTLAAMRALLLKLKREGPSLYQEISARTQYFIDTLNAFFAAEDVPLQMKHFTSFFLFAPDHDKLAKKAGASDPNNPIEQELFYYLLMQKGVYTWEKRICAFSTAHTDEDIETVIRAVKETVWELRDGGFTLF